jgi:hypothetical protein
MKAITANTVAEEKAHRAASQPPFYRKPSREVGGAILVGQKGSVFSASPNRRRLPAREFYIRCYPAEVRQRVSRFGEMGCMRQASTRARRA